jgi:hypothetical protein
MEIYKRPFRKLPLGRSRRKGKIILKWFVGGKDRGANVVVHDCV